MRGAQAKRPQAVGTVDAGLLVAVASVAVASRILREAAEGDASELDASVEGCHAGGGGCWRFRSV